MLRVIKKLIGTTFLTSLLMICTMTVWADETVPVDAAASDSPHIYYQAFQNGAWSDESADQNAALKTPAASIEGIKIRLTGVEGSVQYRVYLSDGGWQSWVSDGAAAGGENTGNPIEAYQVKLDGYASRVLNIIYRGTAAGFGDLGWTWKGLAAGSVAEGKNLTNFAVYLTGGDTNFQPEDGAVRTKLQGGFYVLDGVTYYTDAPGSDYTGWVDSDGVRYYAENCRLATGWKYIDGLKFYFDEQGKLVQDLDAMLGRQSSYKIKVNKELNCLTVYAKDGDNGYIIPVKAMLCSVGDDTPIGTFKTPEKYRWRLMVNDTYTQYATRITAGFLIHSVCYDKPDIYTMQSVGYNGLGTVRSLGCIRLTAEHAKWVYDNCSIGTTIEIYNDSSSVGPFYRPVVPHIPSEQTWDPTDPLVSEEVRQGAKAKADEAAAAAAAEAAAAEQAAAEAAQKAAEEQAAEEAKHPKEVGPGANL